MVSKKSMAGVQIKEMNPGSRSTSLRRGLEVLCLFSDTHPEWGITDISKIMGIAKSSVHRAVKTFEDMGFLRKSPLSRKYTLGFRTFEIGSAAVRQISLIPWARFHLQKLAQETDTTVSVRMLDGDGYIAVLCYESPNDLNGRSRQGIRRPWNFGAAGKLFSAFRPPEQLKKMIRETGLPQYTEKSITHVGTYLREMKEIRKQGYAVSDGEYIPWSFAVSCPIFNPDGNLLAAVVSGTPREGISTSRKKKIISTVVQKTSNVSRTMAQEHVSRSGRFRQIS
ncbi:IclR family transcriptional regulator [Thermodesulfobacteriota bacterium]